MQNLNTIPVAGKFLDVANKANTNFLAIKTAIEQLELSVTRSKGFFSSSAALTNKYPSPVVGDWAVVQDTSVSPPSAYIWKCATNGTWSNSGTEWNGGTIDLSEYVHYDEFETASAQIIKLAGGVINLEAIEKITGKHIYNGNVSGTNIGYFSNIASGYGCYIFNVSQFQGDDIIVYGTSHSTGYRYVFCRDYETFPQSQTEYNNDPTLWTNNMISAFSGKGYTSNLDYNATLKVPAGANYLILEKSSSKTPTARLEYNGVENDLMAIVNTKAAQVDLQIDNYQSIEKESRVAGYINNSGNIASGNYFYTDIYPVTSGKTVRITNKLHTGTAKAYGFYSSSSLSSSTLVKLGATVTSAQEINIETVPSRATYIGIVEFKSSQHGLEENNPSEVKEEVIELQQDVEELQAASVGNDTRTIMAWEIVGNNFYCAYNDGNGIEYTYWFKKCMANELYTFYKVGYRNVTRKLPSTNGISAGTDITYINETSSDNIGPIQLTSGYWIGGNHHYPDENGSQHTIYKTAHTDNVSIYIDNILAESGKGYGKDIIIKVQNTLFNPAFPPSEGDTSLNTPIATEKLTYRVLKNTIEVGCALQFVSGISVGINKYYGMQSMFSSEEYYMTPNGAYYDWRDNTNNPTGSFTKGNYPNFNRYIEKKTGAYQSAYLMPFGLGKHTKVGSEQNIFTRSSNKCYHVQVVSLSNIANLFMQWSGCYTFFHSAITDDTNLLVYRGVIGGKDALYISTKANYSGTITVPNDLALKNISVIESVGITNEDGETTFMNGGDGIYITGNGSLILQFD